MSKIDIISACLVLLIAFFAWAISLNEVKNLQLKKIARDCESTQAFRIGDSVYDCTLRKED
jgi:hypothetical protein